MARALDIRGLGKTYGGLVGLDDVELAVEPGEVLALLGPNGAGKTTLVSIVAGLRRADRGEVAICGIDALRRPREARRHFGLAPQELGISPTLTARQNLRFFGDLSGLRGGRLADRIVDVSEILGLGGVLDTPVRMLSGGEQRRVHTGMALMGRPALLLLDEPTAGVDVQTRSDILELVRDLAGQGTAIVYSTHYLHEVETLGASVAILEDGRLIARGTVDELVGVHAETMVELVFDGPPPAIALADRTAVAGDTLRVFGSQSSTLAATAISALGPEVRRLRSVEIVRPSLESVGVTGMRRRSGRRDGRRPRRYACVSAVSLPVPARRPTVWGLALSIGSARPRRAERVSLATSVGSWKSYDLQARRHNVCIIERCRTEAYGPPQNA
jgi:ABC-2 type transport system ATP-binding protein